jgi:hypothetical protein
VARPEEDGGTERRRLEHGVQTRSVEPPADVRHVGECVEVAEHTDAIDDHDVGVLGAVRAESGGMESGARGPALERSEMRRGRLVRRDDHSCAGVACMEPRPSGEQRALVGGPRGARDEGESR